MACILFWSSTVKVHDSQAYRKVDLTKERISRILELRVREILLSFQTGFSLVNAAVVCAILESSSGLEFSSVITEPRYLLGYFIPTKVKSLSKYLVFNASVSGHTSTIS